MVARPDYLAAALGIRWGANLTELLPADIAAACYEEELDVTSVVQRIADMDTIAAQRALLTVFSALAAPCYARDSSVRDIGLSIKRVDQLAARFISAWWTSAAIRHLAMSPPECAYLLEGIRTGTLPQPVEVFAWLGLYTGQLAEVMRWSAAAQRADLTSRGDIATSMLGSMDEALNKRVHDSPDFVLKRTAYAEFNCFFRRFNGPSLDYAEYAALTGTDAPISWRLDAAGGWAPRAGNSVMLQNVSAVLRWLLGDVGLDERQARGFVEVSARDNGRRSSRGLVVEDGDLSLAWIEWMLNHPQQQDAHIPATMLIGSLNRNAQELRGVPNVEVVRELAALPEWLQWDVAGALSSRGLSLLNSIIDDSSLGSSKRVAVEQLSTGQLNRASLLDTIQETYTSVTGGLAPSPITLLLEAYSRTSDPIARVLVIDTPLLPREGFPEGFFGGTIQGLLGPRVPTSHRAAREYAESVGLGIGPMLQTALLHQLIAARERYNIEVRRRTRVEEELRGELRRFPLTLTTLEETTRQLQAQIGQFQGILDPHVGGMSIRVADLASLFEHSLDQYRLEWNDETIDAVTAVQRLSERRTDDQVQPRLRLRAAATSSENSFSAVHSNGGVLAEAGCEWEKTAAAAYAIARQHDLRLISRLLESSTHVRRRFGLAEPIESADELTPDPRERELIVFQACKDICLRQWRERPVEREGARQSGPWAVPISLLLSPFVEHNIVEPSPGLPVRIDDVLFESSGRSWTSTGTFAAFSRLYSVFRRADREGDAPLWLDCIASVHADTTVRQLKRFLRALRPGRLEGLHMTEVSFVRDGMCLFVKMSLSTRVLATALRQDAPGDASVEFLGLAKIMNCDIGQVVGAPKPELLSLYPDIVLGVEHESAKDSYLVMRWRLY